MAAIDPVSEAARVNWRQLLQNLLPYVDFFLPSIEELCFMLGYPSEQTPGVMAEELLQMGAKVVVIKCGEKGLYCRTAADLSGIGAKAELNTAAWEDQQVFQKAYPAEKICSATGAGDTCIAAFLTAMLEGRALEDCLRLAAATGASCVEAYDALSGLKPFEVLEEKMSRGWGKE